MATSFRIRLPSLAVMARQWPQETSVESSAPGQSGEGQGEGVLGKVAAGVKDAGSLLAEAVGWSAPHGEKEGPTDTSTGRQE